MMNDDLDWSDEFFEGDIDFNDDFDFDPYKNKGLVSGAVSGFLGGLVEHTVGSSEAVYRNVRNFLPNSYSNFFDRVERLKQTRNELVKEFKEENAENVKSLQNIAKAIGRKIDNENNVIKKKLNAFGEEDFSSWEKLEAGSREEELSFEGEGFQSFEEDVNRLIQSQQDASATVVSGFNEMQAQVGSSIISATKAGNTRLLGIESGMRDLLDYHRNVQYKMDKVMVEIAAKSYVLDARFYKFSEKANRKIIEELKRVVVNSGRSDFDKTTLAEQTKQEIRKGAFSVVGKRVGGLLGKVRSQFDSSNRKAGYNKAGDLLRTIEEGLQSEGGGIGAIGSAIGSVLASELVEALPNMLRSGPLRDALNKGFNNLSDSTQERLRNARDRITDIGNTASYVATSGAGVLNYHARNWKDLDIERFNDYDEYVDYAQQNGLRILPKALFYAKEKGGDFVKERINRFMSGVSTSVSKGTQYTLSKRDASALTNVAQWREINNITLVDVIPGWLSKIYESQEKMRTGNDNFKAPVFSYVRGQFMDKAVATKVVKNDIYKHSDFLATADRARGVVKEIDSNGILTEDQIASLASVIVKNADEEYGFNPYQYTGEIEGIDKNLQAVINRLVKERFGITDETLNKFNTSSVSEKLKMNLFEFKGEEASALNRISALMDELKNIIPNIATSIEANREAGNEDLLREMGLIKTKYGVDQIDTSLISDRINTYIRDRDNKELRGDFIDTEISDAGRTKGSIRKNGRTNIVNKTNFSGLAEGIQTLNKTINEKFDKLDFSGMSFDLGDIPDKFDALNKTAEEQKTLLGKISECVCRTANGWGAKTQTEKDKILREEATGKKSLLEKLKTFSPKNFFNRSIEVLAENSPLILTGIASGLAGYAFKDPKAAALIAGGVGVGYLYTKLSSLGNAKDPSDDENIYNENGDVLLYASKLRNRDYFDAVSKTVIKTWKDIKGAVFDAVNKTYVTLSELTGKLFGPDNRRRFLSGLSKAKDFIKATWNKIDVGGNLSRLGDAAKNIIYQQDIYVAGESEPRLTRKGFTNKRYYCLESGTRKPFVLTGWNKIDGPVYELGKDDQLTQIISEGEIAQGLVTSSGIRINTIKKSLGILKDKFSFGLGKLTDYAKEKAGIAKDKINDLITADYTSIETRLDRIYYLLCDEFGKQPQPVPSSEKTNNEETPKQKNKESFKFSTPFDNVFKTKEKESFSKESDYPHKVRMNSFEDKEEQEEKQKRDAFYEDIHSIKENMEGGVGKEDDKEKKKGLFGLLTSGLGMFKKLLTNPLGFIGSGIGMVIGSILKSPLRLVKLGSLLFSSVLGLSSPIYKLLKWGLGGILTALGRSVLNKGGDLLDSILPGRKNRKSKTTKSKTNKSRSSRRMKRTGKGLKGLLAGGLLSLPFMSRGANLTSDDEYDSDEYDDIYDEYDEIDPANYEKRGVRETAQDIVDDAYNISSGVGLGSSVLKGAGMAAGGLAPEASAALQASKLGGAAKLAGGGLKLAGGLAGKAFLPLAALQAGLTFADGESAGEIFNTNVINGTQRAANTITDFLDFGGLTSGLTKGIGNALGFDTTNFDGAATRFVGKLLDNPVTDFINSIPLIEYTPFGVLKQLKNFETDLSSVQRKIRMAMYGINDTKAPLARVLENVERELMQYVKVSEGYVTIDGRAPVTKIVKSLSQANVAEAAVWYKQRFEPVFKLWVSATNLVGFKTLDEFDKDKSPSVVRVVNQVRAAITQFDPYPYDINPVFSSEYPIMDRSSTEALVVSLTKEMNKEFKELGVDEKGDISNKVVIQTAEEVKEGKPKDDSIIEGARSWLNSKYTKLSLIGFEEPKSVIEIDISDLHPGDGAPMDELTLVRLAAYGNTENNPIKVDAVLKLERYCEQFFKIQSGTAIFDKAPKEILGIFKNTFQLVPAWFEHWEKWFTDRFLPVLKTWVRGVDRITRRLPKDGWKTLSSIGRSKLAHELIDVKIDVKGKAVSVWETEQGPFFNTTSGTEISIVKKYIASLDSKSAEQKLKDPTSEETEKGERKPARQLTDDEKWALYHSHGTASEDYLNNIKTPFNTSTGLEVENNSSSSDALTNLASTSRLPADSTAKRNYNESMLPDINSGAYNDVNGTGDNNFTPNATSTEKGLKISPREAKKTIINEFMKKGIKDPKALAFAIANAEEETGFTNTVEGFNYKISALKDNWKYFREHPELAEKYGRNDKTGQRANQKMIAQVAYGTGKKAKELGNSGLEDGGKFIGRGFTQTTGKNNYSRLKKDSGVDVVSHPDLVGSDPKLAALSEYTYFKSAGTFNKIAAGDFKGAAQTVGNAFKHDDGTTTHTRKISKTAKYLKELQSGELKNIVDELSSANGNKGENEETTSTSADNATDVSNTVSDNETVQSNESKSAEGGVDNTSSITTPTVEGINGTDKVNVPDKNSTNASTPSITEPPVKVEAPDPIKQEPQIVEKKETESPQPNPEPNRKVEDPKPVKETPKREEVAKPPTETKQSTPQLTPVYDGAVVGAIEKLTRSLENVLSSPRRVSVSGR